MYNVYKKILILICGTAVMMSSINSCKGKTDDGADEAQAAYNSAQSAYDNGNPYLCIELLDTIDGKFSKDIEVMKQSMQLRSKALAVITDKEIESADSAIEANRMMIDSLRLLMTHVNVPGTEGYSVKTTAVDAGFMNKTGISPRVSEIGEFYIVSSLNPAGGLKHESLTAIVGDMTANSDTVRYDGALNFRTNNSEVITFTAAGSNAIGELVASHPELPVKILFNGVNGRNKSLNLTRNQVEDIATAYRYAHAINAMRDATIASERLKARRAKLEQQIVSQQ